MDDNMINIIVFQAFSALDQQNNRAGEHTHIHEIQIRVASTTGHLLTYKQVRDALYRLRVDKGLSIYHQYTGFYDTEVRAVQL